MRLYRDQLQHDYRIILYKNGRGKHIIEVDDRIDNMLFFYLVNYMIYPEWINYSPQVAGYTIADDESLFDTHILGTRIKVSDARHVKEADQVEVVTSNFDKYRIGFDGNIKAIKGTAILSEPEWPATTITAHELIKITDEIKVESFNHKAFNQRFFIISSAYLVLLSLITLLYRTNNTEMDVFLILIPYLWMILEHDYVLVQRHYLKFLVFSFAIMAFGQISYYCNLTSLSSPIITLSSSSFLFLLLQKVLALIYRLLFKKQPDLDNDSLYVVFFYRIPLYILPVLGSMALYMNMTE